MFHYCCRNTIPAPSRPLLKRLITSSIHQRTNQLTIGIRREDPARLWERRCPLTPSAVEELVQDAGVRVLVQDCNRRVFESHEFERVSLLFIVLFLFQECNSHDLGRSYRSPKSLSSTHSSGHKRNPSL